MGKGDGPFARLRDEGGDGDSRFGAQRQGGSHANAAAGGAAETAPLIEVELGAARDALLADADATAKAGWRVASDAAFYGFHLDSFNHSIFLETIESVWNGIV